MPRIPTYEKQIDAIALPGVRQASNASPGMFRGPQLAGQLGQAAENAGDEWQARATELQQKQNTAAATDLEAKFLNESSDYKIKARERLGQNAAGLPVEAGQWYGETVKKYLDQAPNDAVKQTLGVILTKHQAGFHVYIGDHTAQQLDKAADDGFKANVAANINAAATDPSSAADYASRITASVNAIAKIKGMPAEVRDQLLAENLSNMHTGVVNSLMMHSPKSALGYFAANKDGIMGEQRLHLEKMLKAANDANDAIAGADTVWKALGPKVDGQPVQLDVMESKIREMYAGDAAKIKDTIAEVRSRAEAFNSAERERGASRINAVMDRLAQGASLAQVRQSPDFQLLAGEEKQRIIEHVESLASTRASRAAAMEARADAAESRAERRRYKAAFASYLDYSSPDNIAKVSEAEIRSKLPEFGPERTEALLKTKRGLSSPQRIAEAKMDTEDFNNVAQKFGLRPFETKQSEDDKAALGEFKFRAEHVIQQVQENLKRPLTRQEKLDVMNQEATKMVTIDEGIFHAARQVPILSMRPEQVDAVQMPKSERDINIARLRKLRAMYPDDPRFEPTERNLKMMYLQSKTPNAGLIDGQ